MRSPVATFPNRWGRELISWSNCVRMWQWLHFFISWSTDLSSQRHTDQPKKQFFRFVAASWKRWTCFL